MSQDSEPKWPLIAGSVVPVAALFLSGGGQGGLAEAAVAGVIIVSVGLYMLLSYPLETIVIARLSKRSCLRALQISYSLQCWKLSSFILGIHLFYICSRSTFGLMRSLGPVGSFLSWASGSIFSIALPLVSLAIGIAIINRGHHVKIDKKLLVALIVTEVVVIAALHGFWHMWLLRSSLI